jgi:hypothetical protein
VTTEAASRTPAGEAGFRLLAEHLPNLILLAFDSELLIWAATGAALRSRGWTPGHFVGKTVPEVGRPADAAITAGPPCGASAAGSTPAARPTRRGCGRTPSSPFPTRGARRSAAW